MKNQKLKIKTNNDPTSILKSKSKYSVRNFLEKNKIFFETVLMLLLSFMGLLISIASLNVSQTANTIALSAQENEDLEKQPYFVLDVDFTQDKKLYIIKNTGGRIQSGKVFMDKILLITVYNEDYDYIGNGYVFLNNYLLKSFSVYDTESNCFEIQQPLESVDILNLVDIIQGVIMEKGYYCGIDFTEYFDFSYVDYKQEKINKTMIMEAGYISEVPDSEFYDFTIMVNVKNYNVEEIKESITEELDLLKKYNGNKIEV